MVCGHGYSGQGRSCYPARPTQSFFDQSRLVEKLVTLQDEFLVPVAAVKAKGDRSPLPALAPHIILASAVRPNQQPWL